MILVDKGSCVNNKEAPEGIEGYLRGMEDVHYSG